MKLKYLWSYMCLKKLYIVPFLLTLDQLLQKLYDLPSHRLQAFMQLVVIQSLYSLLEQSPLSFQLLHGESP